MRLDLRLRYIFGQLLQTGVAVVVLDPILFYYGTQLNIEMLCEVEVRKFCVNGAPKHESSLNQFSVAQTRLVKPEDKRGRGYMNHEV